jgi:hypothetical protein
MSVWFKYLGDKDIPVGKPSGASIFGPSGGSIPSGIAYTDYGVEYPVAEGGAEIEITQVSTYVPIEICDVNYIYESFPPYAIVPDWANVTNVVYKPINTYLIGNGTPSSQTPVEIPFESGNYYDSEYIEEYAAFSDGMGDYTWGAYDVSFWAEYTEIFRDYDNELIYYWDGDGDYFTTPL